MWISALFLPLALLCGMSINSMPWEWNSRIGVAVVAPVAIGPLVDDSPFFQQPFQHQRDLERLGPHFADAQGQVFEIDKDGDQGFVGHGVGAGIPILCGDECGISGPAAGAGTGGRTMDEADRSIVAASPGRRKAATQRIRPRQAGNTA